MNAAGVQVPTIGELAVSDAVADKAIRLLDQRRVSLGPIGSDWAIAFGDENRYLVRAWPRGVSCTCPYGRTMNAGCSHAVAAMVRWNERSAAKVEFEPEPGDQLAFALMAVAS